MEQTTQPRYTRTEGVSFEVSCADLGALGFPTYDRADKFLDRHEDTCPLAHRIDKVTVETHYAGTARSLDVGTVNLLALDPRP